MLIISLIEKLIDGYIIKCESLQEEKKLFETINKENSGFINKYFNKDILEFVHDCLDRNLERDLDEEYIKRKYIISYPVHYLMSSNYVDARENLPANLPDNVRSTNEILLYSDFESNKINNDINLPDILNMI